MPRPTFARSLQDAAHCYPDHTRPLPASVVARGASTWDAQLPTSSSYPTFPKEAGR